MTARPGADVPAQTKKPNASEIVFTEIRAEHLEVLTTFFQENDVASVTETFNPFPMNSETASRIASATGRDRYYAAFMSDRIVGLSMLRGWDEGYDVPSFGIVVDHRYHNLGIGARLTEFTVAKAKRLGCQRVRLSVHASNSGAIHIYRACGFVETERQEINAAGARDAKIIMVKTF